MNPAPPPPPTPADERRVAPRRQPALGTVLRLDAPGAGPAPLGLVWNISTTGVSMLLSAPRDAGAALSGFLEGAGADAMLRVAMAVVHVKPLDTGDYMVGARFDRPLTADELRPFVTDV